MAYAEFHLLQPGNTLTYDQLYAKAETLLRGCEQHFRSTITRVKKMHGIVPFGNSDDFEQKTLALLHVRSMQEFRDRCTEIMREYPLTKPWLSWWMRESHASMLFLSHRRMDPDIWDAIPSTTNAEESMHWKLYTASGTQHDVVEGLESLFGVAKYFEGEYDAILGKCLTVQMPTMLKYLYCNQLGHLRTMARKKCGRKQLSEQGLPSHRGPSHPALGQVSSDDVGT